MPDELAPGVYINEILAGARQIAGVSTATTAFIGWTPKGRTDAAVEVESLREFVEEFGDLDSRSFVGHAVRHFFDNGGTIAWIVRLPSPPGVVLTPDSEPFERLLLPAAGGGVFLLDRIAGRVNLLCVPGETTPAVVASLETFCMPRRLFLVADAPQAQPLFSPDPRITGDAARNAAIYTPWLRADPAATPAVACPPSGFVAGVYARTDRTRGVWKAPAGADATLVGAAGPATPMTDREVARLAEDGVNAIRAFGDRTAVWGSRTLAGAAQSQSDWKYVPVRRLAIFIEASVDQGLSWTVFEPNDELLWAAVRASIGDFLMTLFSRSAFAGSTPRDTFFVKCDRETMTADDIADGRLIVLVGFAPLKPAEFVVLRIGARAAKSTVE